MLNRTAMISQTSLQHETQGYLSILEEPDAGQSIPSLQVYRYLLRIRCCQNVRCHQFAPPSES